MSTLIHLAAGLALALIGWVVLRVVARTGKTPRAALAIDIAPVLAGWIVGLAATGRPGFAGAVILALACGLAIADHTKRAVLREPIVFADSAELLQVFTNPELYLPFLPQALFYGGGAALIAGALSLIPLEPGLWDFAPWHPVVTAAIFVWAILSLAHPPLLTAEAAWLRRHLSPSGDPTLDAVRFGPLTSLLTYGTIARDERPIRRARVRPGALLPGRPEGPIVVVQSESFFDARRLSAGIARDLLPNFDALRGDGAWHGQFTVPGWGANTMRTEFAVLTGLDEATIGLDRFNPYHKFARAPVESLAWKLRQAGYRTVCVHPYSRKFYRRHLVLPMLGFDEFFSIESFDGAERVNGFVSDAALARFLARLLAASDGRLFLFAMSMENHGPWQADAADQPELAPGLPQDRAFRSLRRYLVSSGHADAMLPVLSEAIAAHDGGTLAFYGDHLPSLPDAFDALGFTDPRADYLIWSRGRRLGGQRDLAAHELPALILDAAAAADREAETALEIDTSAALQTHMFRDGFSDQVAST